MCEVLVSVRASGLQVIMFDDNINQCV